MVEQEVDGLYEKYRVFKEPEAEEHPVGVIATWHDGRFNYRGPLEEIMDSFVFVLKPDTDHHARVALAAYAESVSREKPKLANDLRLVLATTDLAEVG